MIHQRWWMCEPWSHVTGSRPIEENSSLGSPPVTCVCLFACDLKTCFVQLWVKKKLSSTGRWWAFRLARARTGFVCYATHRWGNRPRDLVFPGWGPGQWRLSNYKSHLCSFLPGRLPESPLVDRSGRAPGDLSHRQLQVLFDLSSFPVNAGSFIWQWFQEGVAWELIQLYWHTVSRYSVLIQSDVMWYHVEEANYT